MARVSKQGNISAADREILDTAIKQLKRCVDADQHNRTAATEDLKFANGDQWDSGEKKRREDKGRPALQINLLPKFIDQVVGDMLHNSPSIKVRPVDSKGDINIAKIRQGLISDIEYRSNSAGIYGYGARQQVTCGYGAWRVLTRYTEENPFLQEAYLEGIRNPFLVYMDPTAKDQNYADAQYGFILERMPEEEFRERYPKAQYTSVALDYGAGLSEEMWYEGNTVTVAEYFTVETEKVTMLQLSDGVVISQEDFDEYKKEWKEKSKQLVDSMAATPPAPEQPPVEGAPPQEDPIAERVKALGSELKVMRSRVTEQTVIRHRIITAGEILEGGTEGARFPGKFIPIVLLKGKELNIEGKNHVYSLIRHAKDPQKLVNYWNSAAAETIALAPKAPWLGTARQFEGYENDYALANVENFAFLKYNPDAEAPGPPMRQSPGQPPTAIFEQIARGEENLKSVIGLFNADVGAPGSEQTGAAINARQRPGDIGTYEFSVNLSRAVLYTGRILNEIIPDIYDTERDIRMRNNDETETFVPVNTTVGAAAKAVESNPETYAGLDAAKIKKLMAVEGSYAKFNDITSGKYDVVITTGPSYATQRQEAAQHLLMLAQSMPQQMSLAADLIVQNLDFKDNDELAERLRKTLPAGIAKPRPGDPPPAPPQPDPAVQMKMQTEQMKLEMGKLKLEAEKMKLEGEKIKMQLEIAQLQAGKNPVPEYDPIEMQEKDRRFQLDMQRLDLESKRLQHQMQTDGFDRMHGRQKDEAKLQLEAMKTLQGGKNE